MQTNDRSVSCRMCFPSGDHMLRKLQRFLFCLRLDVFSVLCLLAQRVLFCLSPYLFSEWHIVPQLYIQIKQSRVHSRKALSECKASRRLGKQIRGLSRFLSTTTYWLSRFLSKAHLAAPYNIQGSYNNLSSVFRLRLIEAITFPFHLQKSKYSLSISLSPRSIFCNNRLLRNFLLSPSTLYGPTL